MGFLDNIGQRRAEPQSFTPAPIPDPPFAWDTTPPSGSAAPDAAPRASRVHAGVVWSGVLIVVAAVAVAAWLGARKVMSALPRTQADAPAATEAPTPEPSPTPVTTSARARTGARHGVAGRSRASVEEASSTAAPDVTSEAVATTTEAVNETPAASENATAPIEAGPDPVPAALVTVAPEDDSVYSNDATDIVAPRLVSLGFNSPPVKGFAVRTSKLELIISKSGTVERARVSSSSENWEDAMLLSRAKMFQFVPALRNGAPVRFRYVMEVAAAP